MRPPPDSSATATHKKKKRKRSEGQAGSSVLVATGTPECEQKRKKFGLSSPAEHVRMNKEEQQSDGQMDKKAGEVTAKKKKKKKRDKQDVERMVGQKKKKKKKQRDRDVCKLEKKRNNDKLLEKETEGKPVCEEGVMEEDQRKECLTETAEGQETGDLREQLIEELKEFIPDVRKRSADNVSKLIKYDLQRFRSFRQQGESVRPDPDLSLSLLTRASSTGVALRWGRCSQEENLQIKRNVQDFLALTGISSADQLLFPHRYKEQEEEIRQLKKRHHFLTRIGTPRPPSARISSVCVEPQSS